MTIFDDRMAAAAERFLDVFSEPVVLIAPDGTERTVRAVVDRSPNRDLGGGMGTSWAMEMELANDATTGLAAAEFDAGQWQVTLPVRIGADAVTRTIGHLLSQDAGFVRVAVA